MTDRGFEQLLEHCLQEIARTGDSEGLLRRHPQHAERLRPLLEIAQATGRAYADVPEPPGGLAAGRERLLHTAALERERTRATENSEPRKERKPTMKLVLATKLISAVLALAVGTAAVGGGVAWAANDSLPGDTLYPVKLTAENVRLSLASSSESQVALAMQFADERVAEMEELAGQGQPVPESVVARMERHIVQAMNQTAWASEEEMPGLLERIAQRTQAQAQALEQLRARAEEQNQAQLENAHRICRQASEEATAGLGEPQTYRERFQNRESMPEEMTPPEPSAPEPQNGGQGEQGPQGPNSEERDTPQGDHDPEQEREREQNQDEAEEPRQEREQEREQQQDQDGQGEQQQDQDREQDQDRQRDPEDGHEPIHQRDQDRDQDPEGDPPRGEPDEQPGQNDDDEPNRDQGQDQQQDQEDQGESNGQDGDSGKKGDN